MFAINNPSLEVDDTDDEYYSRLFEEEMNGVDDGFETEAKIDATIRARNRNQNGNMSPEQDARVTEYLVREAVEQRKVKRRQVKKSQRLKTASQRALNALGLIKPPPKEAKLRQCYHKLKGVYARLLEALDNRHEEATGRARLFIAEREAQLAALAMENKGRRISQHDNLKTIESMREQESKQIQLLTNLSLSRVLKEDYNIEEISKQDLITVLRIRGNVKGIRKDAKRTTLMRLLEKSFDTPLY